MKHKLGISRRQFLITTAAGSTLAAAGWGAGLPPKMDRPTRRGLTSAETPVVKLATQPLPPGMILARLNVNAVTFEVAVEPTWTLAETLREHLGLTGTKIGCDRGECGTCTVLVEGRPIYSCMALAVETQEKAILTIEGLAQGGKLHPIQQAFVDYHGLACGFCTPSMILSAKALLDRNSSPSKEDIRAALAGNLCRCTGYEKIIESVQAAAKLL